MIVFLVMIFVGVWWLFLGTQFLRGNWGDTIVGVGLIIIGILSIVTAPIIATLV